VPLRDTSLSRLGGAQRRYVSDTSLGTRFGLCGCQRRHELLMNASKATLRTHALREELPPMRVVVAAGDADVTIKVADEGGGLPRSRLRGVWSYRGRWEGGHADPALQGSVDLQGLGLPIARLYAKYFGGSLHLTPVEGYGTDCYATFASRPDASCASLLALGASQAGHSTNAGGVGRGLYDAQARR
jgi:hypothetical protein